MNRYELSRSECLVSKIMPRVLLIAFRYPPSEAIGAMRPAALAKYLPQLGWDMTVLTPKVKQRAADPRLIETDYQDVIADWKNRLGLDARVGVHEQLGLPVSSKPRSNLLQRPCWTWRRM